MNGTTPNPTDEEVESDETGHAEAVLVAFDPIKVSYTDLLKAFFEEHDPTQGMRQGSEVGTHVRSGIYCVDRNQRASAETPGVVHCALVGTGVSCPSPAPA